MVSNSNKLTQILKIDYSHTVIKDDVIIVYLNNGIFWLCDKDFGVKNHGDYYEVIRVFGRGKRGELCDK